MPRNNLPCESICRLSRLNEDMVLNPPQKPVIRKGLIKVLSGCLMSSIEMKIPAQKLLITLTVNVANGKNGNVGYNNLFIAHLDTPPMAAPSATYITSIT